MPQLHISHANNDDPNKGIGLTYPLLSLRSRKKKSHKWISSPIKLCMHNILQLLWETILVCSYQSYEIVSEIQNYDMIILT